MSDPTSELFSEAKPHPVRRKGEIHIGTSGYSFADWRGAFYPERLPRSQWLPFYARYFTVVEINATYYRTPPPSTFQGMVQKTPDNFGFWVKVPGEATHGAGDPAEVMEPFKNSIRPLEEAGRLRGTLAQFPFSFRRDRAGEERIFRIHDSLEGIPLAIEFRRDEWLTEEVYSELESRGLILVMVDLPSIPGLPRREVRVTGAAAYVRFHGRNARNWNNPRLGDRYDWEYSRPELSDWLPRIALMDGQASLSYLFFNNCHVGQAVKNARMLQQMLELEPVE